MRILNSEFINCEGVMNYITTAITDIGTTKNTNQDSLLIKSANTNIGKVLFAVICDGMGGLAKGEVASATVINAFNKWFLNELPILIDNGLSDEILKDSWNGIIKEQNNLIMNYGKNNSINLGTTVCAILITENWYCCVNVGDSRCYEIYDSLYQITVDQTLVQREYEAGRISFDELKTDPRRSVLLQCVGCNNDVNPVYYFGMPKVNCTYLLCSDGFRHEITESEIYNSLNPESLENKEIMTNNAIALIEANKQRGETDNITVLLVKTV